MDVDLSGRTKPALGKEVCALHQKDKGTTYAGVEGLTVEEPEVVAAAFLEHNAGHLQEIEACGSDNGSEFDKDFHKALVDNNIRHPRSVPHTPATHSPIERWIQDSQNGVRCNAVKSKLSYLFWLLSLLHWTCTFNRHAAFPEENHISPASVGIVSEESDAEELAPGLPPDVLRGNKPDYLPGAVPTLGPEEDEFANPALDFHDDKKTGDVAMSMVAKYNETVWELEDEDRFDYSQVWGIEDVERMAQSEMRFTLPSIREETVLNPGVALSTRKQREARRVRSPWERRWKKKYAGKLAPFGSRVVFLNDGTSQALGKPLKYEPRGRVGILVGYGPIGSFLILDYRMYTEKNRIILKLTRDCRLFPNEYPLAAIQSITTAHLESIDEMEKDQECGSNNKDDDPGIIQGGLRFNSEVGTKCKTCDKWIVAPGTKVKCGRCNNPSSKVKHQYGIRCKVGWCLGHATVSGGPSSGSLGTNADTGEVYPHLDPVDDSGDFMDADEGEPDAPPATAPPGPLASSSSGPGMGGALQRTLQRTAQVMGTGAIMGAAQAAGMGPLQSAIATAVSSAVGESLAGAVTGLINPGATQGHPSSSSSSSSSTTPGTGVDVGGSTVYPQQAVHGITGVESSGGSSSSDVARLGASGMLARAVRAAREDPYGGMLVPPMHVPTPKGGGNPFASGYALVTMNLKRNDPLLSTAAGIAATEKEVGMLLKSGAFVMEEVMEASEARWLFPDSLFVPLNPIYAVKHWELPEEFHVLKCRIVAGGDQISTASGERVTGKDETRAMLPAAMSGVRGVVAYAHAVKGVTRVFDVEGAYVKSKLGGSKTFGRLNKCLRPAWWADYFRDPVNPIHMAMYGIPRAGFDWDDEFGGKATYIGMVRVNDTEGSMWFYECKHGTAVLVMYVDDGVLGGPKIVVDYLIGEFQKYYLLKVQDGLSQTILGMVITVIIRDDRILVAFRMEDYIQKMYYDFCADVGKQELKKYATPEYPENYDFGELHEKPGKHQPIARRYIGRTLYVVRAVRIDSYHAVIVIATEVESWDLASDAKLERLVSYMGDTSARGPTWEFYLSDGCSSNDIWNESESDADHGSCLRTGRSFSGWITLMRHGHKSWAMVDFGCVRQKVAAISTAHSELGACKDAYTKSVLPVAGAWEQCLQRELYVSHLLDSDAARKAIAKGLSIALRYMRKAARISLATLHDMSQGINVGRVDSKENKSDILTKPMDQQTLTKHLYSLGFYTLEWIEMKKENNTNSGVVAAAIAYHLRQSIVGGLVKVYGRSV